MVSRHSASQTKNMHNPFPMHATYPTYLIVCSISHYFVKSGDYPFSHNIIFFIPVLPCPFRPIYHSLHPILMHPQPVFLPSCERSGLTPSANIIVNHLWNWIIFFILKSPHFFLFFLRRYNVREVLAFSRVSFIWSGFWCSPSSLLFSSLLYRSLHHHPIYF